MDLRVGVKPRFSKVCSEWFCEKLIAEDEDEDDEEKGLVWNNMEKDRTCFFEKQQRCSKIRC